MACAGSCGLRAELLGLSSTTGYDSSARAASDCRALENAQTTFDGVERSSNLRVRSGARDVPYHVIKAFTDLCIPVITVLHLYPPPAGPRTA